MIEPRKKLSDILAGGNGGGNIRDIWNNTVAADDFKPLPSGEYTFRILAAEPFNAKTGTPGYKLTLEVTEGEYEGRRAWHDLWLTKAAMPQTKRDLAKIGVTDPEQLDKPLPPGILIRGKLVIHRDDNGNELNRLKRFDFVGIEPGDAFEPPGDGPDQGGPTPPSPNGSPEANGAPAAFSAGSRQGERFLFGANTESDDADQAGKDFLSREKGGHR